MELITRIEGKLDGIVEKVNGIKTDLEVVIAKNELTTEKFDEKVAELKCEVEKLELAVAAVKADIKSLESWRSYMVGAISIVTIIVGIAWRWVERKFGGG